MEHYIAGDSNTTSGSNHRGRSTKSRMFQGDISAQDDAIRRSDIIMEDGFNNFKMKETD